MCAPEAALLGLLLAAPAAPALPPMISPPPAAPPIAGYELRPAKDGSDELVYEGPRFSARVAVDGTVKFGKKRPEHPLWWPPFLPVPIDNGRPSLQSTLSAALRGKKQPAVESDKVVDESFLLVPNVTRYRPDPREGTSNRITFDALPVLSASGKSDLTESLMLFSGQDPSRIEKARFLTATRELRIKRAAHAHAVWLREATAALPKRLEEIAGDERLTVAERRAILEALATEMDDTPAGRDAAARIRAFVTKRFPDAPAPALQLHD